jgi:uncharacterized protein (TIGR03437 family)
MKNTRASLVALAWTLFLAGAPTFAQQYVIATVAGGAPPASGIPAVKASIGDPPRVAVDAAGNVYFGSSSSVFEVDRTGTLMRIAGTGRRGTSGDNGPALSAQLSQPNSIAVDGAGNLYVADEAAHTVRRISAAGTITLYAGSGTPGFSGDGGPATAAQLNAPNALALDTAGNLYIADKNNNRIRAVSPDGHITTIAGNGFPGFGGDSGAARDAALNGPEGVALDASGNIYIADTQNYRVRRVAVDGTIATVAGVGNGNVFGDNGNATAAGLVLPTSVAVDRLGNLYIADFGNSRIRVVSPAGTISTAVGSSKGIPLADLENAVSVVLNGPTGVAVDFAGNIYFTEGSIGTGTGLAQGDFRIWKVSPEIVLTVFAGTGDASYSGDGAASASAQLNNPTALALDAEGNLYIADARNHRVRRVTPGGVITTVAGNGNPGFSGDGGPAAKAQLSSPQGVAVDAAGYIVIADTGNSRIRKVAPDGTINSYIGNGNSSYFGDGLRDFQASINHPRGVAVDAGGAVYIADTLNNAVRKVGTDGIIRTIAGTGLAGFAGDGVQATAALLNGPTGVAVDTAGNIYIADGDNQRLRKIGIDGVITTAASFVANPQSVATDAVGNVYVTAGADHRVWLLAGNRNAAPIAGTGDCCYSGDGGPALNAQMYNPAGVAVDRSGNVYVSDAAANAVRVLVPSNSPIPTLTSVVNGASNLTGPVAPGEVVVLYGTGLGPAQLNQSGGGGASVLFNGTPGTIIYASASQVSAVAPASLTGANVQVWVQYQSLATPVVTLPIAAVSPGLFTLNDSGKGQAAAINFDGSANSASHPSGGILTLFATGVPANAPLAVIVGGLPATVLSQGQVSNIVKITVQLPASVFGSAIPVVIQAGNGVSSQDGVTLAAGGN